MTFTERETPAGTTGPRALERIAPGSTFGAGSLPHRSVRAAAAFSFSAYDVPTIPSLPRRCPAEAPIAQALVGVTGVGLGQYGSVAIDAARLDPTAEVVTDLERERFRGLRGALRHGAEIGYAGPVKWQFAGPMSVGLALMRAGARRDVAFEVARRAVSAHLEAIATAVSAAMPGSSQLVVLDEPYDHGDDAFPLSPAVAADIVSATMASIQPIADVGIQPGVGCDLRAVLESGPQVVSVPVASAAALPAGYLARHLDGGGWIAWGIVAPGGPIGLGGPRLRRRLDDLWTGLADRGIPRDLIEQRSLLTTVGGLEALDTPVAEHVCEILAAIAHPDQP